MKPRKQPTASRKPPILSVEEELAELLSDPTLKPSIAFLGLRSDTESVSDTCSVPDTDSVSGTTSVSVRSSVFGVPKLGFGTPKPRIDTQKPRPAAPEKLKSKGLPRYERPKPVAASQVQDGHSHSEHAMYTTLWDVSEPYSPEARVVTMGFGAMSRIVRLSLNNCRLNIRSLIRKLAVEEWKAAECERKIGKTYLIYNTNAILRRRKTTGLEWVIRTRGVAFVNPTTGASMLPEDTASVSDTKAVSGTEGVSDTVSVLVTCTETVGVGLK